jgi:hypothetical protein
MGLSFQTLRKSFRFVSSSFFVFFKQKKFIFSIFYFLQRILIYIFLILKLLLQLDHSLCRQFNFGCSKFQMIQIWFIIKYVLSSIKSDEIDLNWAKRSFIWNFLIGGFKVIFAGRNGEMLYFRFKDGICFFLIL